jgi:hypothetical protein
MSRFNYKIVEAGSGRYAIIREMANGDVAGYDAAAARNDEQRHFAIYRASGLLHAIADSRKYSTLEDAERLLDSMGVS